MYDTNSRNKWKLVVEDTGVQVTAGMKLKDFRGSLAKVSISVGQPPHKESSTGRIFVMEHNRGHSSSYFPSVFGCKWIYEGADAPAEDLILEKPPKKRRTTAPAKG